MTKQVDRFFFAVLVIWAATGVASNAPEVGPGAGLLVVLSAVVHVIVAAALLLWGTVELVIALRAWWNRLRS